MIQPAITQAQLKRKIKESSFILVVGYKRYILNLLMRDNQH